jgi:L-lactate dehydrogenase complex protein LldG
MSAREDILGRVRAGLKRNESNAVTARAEIVAVLAARTQGPRPAVPTEKSALAGRLIEKSEAQSCTVDTVATLAEAPAAVARYLAGLNLGSRAVIWPSLATLGWQAAGIEAASRGAEDKDLVGITS